jgi:hypothetical protein
LPENEPKCAFRGTHRHSPPRDLPESRTLILPFDAADLQENLDEILPGGVL